MLVLTRRPNETIVIDGRIKITLVQIQGGTVRLGIEAPRELRVNRGEVEAKIAGEHSSQHAVRAEPAVRSQAATSAA
jgi:carbon storage regulator